MVSTPAMSASSIVSTLAGKRRRLTRKRRTTVRKTDRDRDNDEMCMLEETAPLNVQPRKRARETTGWTATAPKASEVRHPRC